MNTRRPVTGLLSASFGCWILAAATTVTVVQADDSSFVDSNIPKDWRNYFSKDVMQQLAKSTTNPKQSKNIFQGDITGVHPESALKNTTEFANKIVQLWSSNLVFYEFGQIDRHVQEFTKTAMDDLESKTCIRFMRRKTEEPDYLYIAGGASCESDVGRTGGKQAVLMNPGCQDGLGATQHELLHALGVIHEQARVDRDNFVWINSKNIQNDAAAQFVEQPDPAVAELNITYDYESVMHYPWNAYAINPRFPTIIPKERGAYFGQRFAMSHLDIQRVNKLYECDRVKRPPNMTVDYSKTWKDWQKLCDGIKDTLEGWDEDPDVCIKMCDVLDDYRGYSLGLFNLPTTKRCMMKTYLCDGIKDSPTDVSEEIPICKQFCRGGGYVAIAPSYQCINFQYLCDGHNDTRDGSDEIRKNCDYYCRTLAEVPTYEDVYFQLEPLGRCMMKIWLCDGIRTNQYDTTEEIPICNQYCKGGGYFNTNDTRQCIHWSKLCDGWTDTTDNWDEDPDNCLSVCPIIPGLIGYLINLPVDLPRCMRKTYLCDGIQDNKDDVSEVPEICKSLCNGNGYFPTPDINQCIRATSLCDGIVDTRNGWDELKDKCLECCKVSQYNDLNVRVENVTDRCLLA